MPRMPPLYTLYPLVITYRDAIYNPRIADCCIFLICVQYCIITIIYTYLNINIEYRACSDPTP